MVLVVINSSRTVLSLRNRVFILREWVEIRIYFSTIQNRLRMQSRFRSVVVLQVMTVPTVKTDTAAVSGDEDHHLHFKAVDRSVSCREKIVIIIPMIASSITITMTSMS